MKTSVTIFVIICFFLPNTFSQKAGDILWTQPFLQEEDMTNLDRLKFGYLIIPENYDEPEGKLFKMAFVIIKAQIQAAEKDAVLYFMGGWGSAAIKNLDFYKNNFLSYKRDLIIFDYRGSGYSQPQLCPDLGEAVYQNVLADLGYAKFQEEQKVLMADCLNQLRENKLDMHQFGSDTKARDAILLAEKLGYESYNLFGVSYGTKTILQYVRQSTDKIRSLILDSNCPLDYPINSAMISDYAQSFQKIIAACKADEKCAAKYPKLKENYLKLLNSLETKPLKVKLPKNEVLYLNRQEMNAVIHQLLYLENFYPYLPKIIHKFSKRNKLYLNRVIRNIPQLLKANYNGLGLINYVYDHKAFQAEALEKYEESMNKYPAFELFDGYLAYFLTDEIFRQQPYQLPQIEVPSLILAGAFDPTTPTYYSQRLLPYFKQKYYYEFPNTGHGVTDNYCGRQLTDAFLFDPINFEEPACLKRLEKEKINFR
ncbi:MAG: alpha/beta fold hydrolase [Bacteroidota bacterium]